MNETPPIPPVTPPAAVPMPPKSKRQFEIAAAAFVIVVLAVVGGYVYWQNTQQAPVPIVTPLVNPEAMSKNMYGQAVAQDTHEPTPSSVDDVYVQESPHTTDVLSNFHFDMPS